MTRHYGSASMEGSFLSSTADVKFKGEALADTSRIGCSLHHPTCRFISRSIHGEGREVWVRDLMHLTLLRQVIVYNSTVPLCRMWTRLGLKTDSNRALSTCVSLESWGKSHSSGDRPVYPIQSHCARPRKFITST